MKLKNKLICFLFSLLAMYSCRKDASIEQPIQKPNQETGNEEIRLKIPLGFPYPEVPLDNLPTKNRIALGRELFFDPILSRDSTISCGTCHMEKLFFQDNKTLSIGIDKRVGTRNAPSIINIAYQNFFFFWDGGVPTMEQQILGPIENPLEMDSDINKVVERLNNSPSYVQKFLNAYNAPPSVYTLTRAISNFERTLIGGTSRYDLYANKIDTNALNDSEKRGLALFFNEIGDCFHCHQGFNFTDNSFRNTGLYEVYADSGRARITGSPLDVGRFKVPSLRNIEKTAPYMHDGSMQTLEEVINHYNSGGKRNRNKSNLMRPLGMTENEKKDLINFLKSLTDITPP